MIEPLTGHPVAGRYVLVDQIGSGAMGSVWRAYDLRIQRSVAAKVLTHHNSAMLLRFVREQGLRIRHPHVVAPTSWAADDDAVVFAMDLVRGGSVQDLLAATGPVPTEYAAVLLDQLLQALAAVHAAGVVHRDVKPANLLLEATGRAWPHLRLGDFGVAAVSDTVRLTQVPGAVGTEGYMAPEQALGAAPDPRQDLYAAGRVAIQLLTGLRPTMQRREIPEGPLAPLLGRLVAENPSDRPASAEIARRELLLTGVAVRSEGTQRGWPEVPDRLGDVAIPLRQSLGLPVAPQARTQSSGVLVALACFAAAIALSATALAHILT